MRLHHFRHSMRHFVVLAGLLSCMPLPAAYATPLPTEDGPALRKGVSTVLDSPEPYAFRQITPFVLQNFGIIEHEELKKHTDDTENPIPLWNIKAKFKKAAEDTKKLADDLAHTPKQEQFAIAAQLTEYDPTFDSENQPVDSLSNIVSIDLLRELQFLNSDYQSILKAISRTTTKGGDLSIIALVCKCCDHIPTIKARGNFVKFLIDNPMVLETLKEHLETIKTAEPLLFSNYRPFKQARLKEIVKGGLIKAFIKQQFASRPNVEQWATQAELIYKPLISFGTSIVMGCAGGWDFFKSLRSNGTRLSTFGTYAQTGVNMVQSIPVFNWPHKFITHLSEKRAWRSFLHHKLAADDESSFKKELIAAQTEHEEKPLFDSPSLMRNGKPLLKKSWFSRNFWDIQKDNFFAHYDASPRADVAERPIFSTVDPDKNALREILTAELLQQQIDKNIHLNHPGQSPTPSVPATPATPASAADAEGADGSPRAATASPARQGAKALMLSTTRSGFTTINDEDLISKAQTLLEIEYTPAERNKIYNKLALIGLIVGGALVLPTIEMSYKDYMANYLDLKNLFDSVQSPYKIYQAAREMHGLLASFPETKHLYPDFIPSDTKPWNHFLKLVTSRTFKRSFGPFDVEFVRKNHGEVVQAYECLNKSQAEIGELIRFYGELDAYVSMAQLVKEFSHKNNNQGVPVRYSFVEFIENSPFPRFEADHYWNPMFSPERVVPNKINLGENGFARNIVVTGANAGGKSGNLKAILTAIILGQTFGIAPAQNLKMTAFSNILATLKSNDDAANNKSRFQVEALEMAKVMQRILLTPANKFTAVFSDELFAGTEIDPAIALSRRICLSLADMPNVMYMLATHYKELTKLEVLTNGIFKNFKVEVIKLPDGSLFRPYMLLEGIGGTGIAFDVFREQLNELGMKNDYLYAMIEQAKLDQQDFELVNPVKTLGKEVFFADRKDF